MKYRPEIDGLRAVAVISVIIYHMKLSVFNQPILTGGFIGVDIFFVISGYLLTRLILIELDEKNRFSFLNFYERRARRILPALFTVIIISIPAAMIFLSPSRLLGFFKSIFSTLGFFSNFYFQETGLVYGAHSPSSDPLLHTWSLSVEEQFYVVLPLFLMISHFLFKKYQRLLLVTFITINLVALGLNYGVRRFFISDFVIFDPVALLKGQLPGAFFNYKAGTWTSFYMIFGRFWEFLAGALVAKFETEHAGRAPPKKNTNSVMLAIGLVLILYSLLTFNNSELHPSFMTILPIMGTCILIWFCDSQSWLSKILSSRLLSGIGLISYSLYLWHYPIFAFHECFSISPDFSGELATIFPSPGFKIGKEFLLLLITGLSIPTYYYIERPFRNHNRMPRKTFWLLGSFMSVGIVAAALIISVNAKKFKNRYVVEGVEIDNQFIADERREYENKNSSITFTRKDSLKVLIIGNSHGVDSFITFDQNKELFQKFEFAFWPIHVFSLKMVLAADFKPQTPQEILKLNAFAQSNIVVLSTKWGKDDVANLDEVLLLLKKTGKKIVLMSHAPEFPMSGDFTLIDQFLFFNQKLPNSKESQILKHSLFQNYKNDKRVTEINVRLKSAALKFNVPYLDKSLLFCEENTQACEYFSDSGNKLMYDGEHYSVQGAAYLGKVIHKLNWFNIGI